MAEEEEEEDGKEVELEPTLARQQASSARANGYSITWQPAVRAGAWSLAMAGLCRRLKRVGEGAGGRRGGAGRGQEEEAAAWSSMEQHGAG